MDAAVAAAVLVESEHRGPLPVRPRPDPAQPLRRAQPRPAANARTSASPKPSKLDAAQERRRRSPSSRTTGSPPPDPRTSTRPSTTSDAPATPLAMRSPPTTPSAGTNKRSISSRRRAARTSSNAPRSRRARYRATSGRSSGIPRDAPRRCNIGAEDHGRRRARRSGTGLPAMGTSTRWRRRGQIGDSGGARWHR